MHIVEREMRAKYRYSKLSYVFDVYMECEYRANLTQVEYDGLLPGEFRFDYESWGRRLGFTKKQMERAIKELTTKNVVIKQTLRGNKGTPSKYILTRLQEKKEDNKRENKYILTEFREKNKEHNKESDKRTISVGNTGFNNVLGEQKEKNKEKEKAHSSRYNNLDIISNNNIYSAKTEQIAQHIWSFYPKKRGKKIAIERIKSLLEKYSFEELDRCVYRYSEEVQGKESEFILNGSTFFKDRFIDYLDENFVQTEQNNVKVNGFNNFKPRQYDYDDLEKKLLGWDK